MIPQVKEPTKLQYLTRKVISILIDMWERIYYTGCSLLGIITVIAMGYGTLKVIYFSFIVDNFHNVFTSLITTIFVVYINQVLPKAKPIKNRYK